MENNQRTIEVEIEEEEEIEEEVEVDSDEDEKKDNQNEGQKDDNEEEKEKEEEENDKELNNEQTPKEEDNDKSIDNNEDNENNEYDQESKKEEDNEESEKEEDNGVDEKEDVKEDNKNDEEYDDGIQSEEDKIENENDENSEDIKNEEENREKDSNLEHGDEEPQLEEGNEEINQGDEYQDDYANKLKEQKEENVKENKSTTTNITSKNSNNNNLDDANVNVNSYSNSEKKNYSKKEGESEIKDYFTNVNIKEDRGSSGKKKKIRSAEEFNLEEFINIINDIEIINLLDEKKWENRKNGFMKLNQFILDNNFDKNNFDIFFMYIYIKLNSFKETNFNLMKEGIQCIISMFSQINNNYDNVNNKITDKKYIKTLLNDLFEKIADNKLKDTYLNLLDILQNNYSIKEILDILFEKLKNTNKVNVLKEYAIYIKYLIEIKKIFENNEENIDIKNIIDFAIKLSNNANPQVRKIAVSIFCLLYKYIGPDLKLFIKEIKNESTLKVIEKELSQITIDTNNLINKDRIMKISNDFDNKAKNAPNEQIPKKNLKRIDLTKEIPNSLLNDISKGKWNEKKEAIEFLHKLLDKCNNYISVNGLDNLFQLIKDKLKDGNKNLVKLIIELLSHFIEALGPQIKKYSKTIILSLLSNLSEKTPQVREECIKCIQKWTKCQNFEIFCVHFPKLLNNDNFEMRCSILDLLMENCNLITEQFNKNFFDELIKSILICLQDKTSTVRNKTEEFMKKFKLIKREDYIKEAKEFKPAITEYLLNNIKLVLGEGPDLDSFKPTTNESILNSNNKTKMNKNESVDNIKAYSSNNNNHLKENKTDKKKNHKYNKIKRHSRFDSCPNVIKSDQKINKDNKDKIQKEETKNNIRVKNTKSLAKRNVNKTNSNFENKNKKKDNSIIKQDIKNKEKTPIKLRKNTDKNDEYLNKTVNNVKTNKSFYTNEKKPNDFSDFKAKNNNSIIIDKALQKKISLNNDKNKKLNYILLNMNSQGINDNLNQMNRSVILNKNSLKLDKDKDIQVFKNKPVFLPNYKFKSGEKEKRLEIDLRNNFLFEIQNFDYLKKIKESTKKVFSPEFHKQIFSMDIPEVISSINKLKYILEKKGNNDDEENLFNLINNVDIVLKILGYALSANQSSSLIKNFFEFSETLINYYEKESIMFNDIESNILLNIFCDKLLNNNVQLTNYSNNLITKLTEMIGENKIFMMLIHLIQYKIVKLRYKIIDIIIKIHSNSNIDNSTLSKTLINIINLWFESDHNIKNKIKAMIKKIYISLGKSEFKSIIKYLTDKQKDEVFLKILDEDENNIYEILNNEEDKINFKRSRSVCRRPVKTEQNNLIKPNNTRMSVKKDKNKSTILEIYSELKGNDKTNRRKNNDLISDKKKLNYNNTTNTKNIIAMKAKNKNNLDKNDKNSLNIKKNNVNKDIKGNRNNNILKTESTLLPSLNRSQILDNKKILTKIKNNKSNMKNNMKINIENNNKTNNKGNKINTNTDININQINNKANNLIKQNKTDNSNALTNQKLKSLLNSLYESLDDEGVKRKMILINNIHEAIFLNFLKNKEIILENSNLIISTFINITKKYFENIEKEIMPLKLLTNSLSSICSIKELLSNIAYEVEKNLIELIFYVVLYKDLNIMGKNKEGLTIWKNYNSIMLRTIDYCYPLNTIKIIVDKIINNNSKKQKYIEFCIRCLELMTQNMKEICDKISVSDLLYIINNFLLEYNQNQKIQKQKIIGANIIGTFKELVCEMANIRGEKIIEDYYDFMNIQNNNFEEEERDKNIKLWINEVIRTIDSNFIIK